MEKEGRPRVTALVAGREPAPPPASELPWGLLHCPRPQGISANRTFLQKHSTLSKHHFIRREMKTLSIQCQGLIPARATKLTVQNWVCNSYSYYVLLYMQNGNLSFFHLHIHGWKSFCLPVCAHLHTEQGAHQLICNTDDAGPSSALFKKYSQQLGSASQRSYLPSLTWILYVSIKYRIIWRNAFIVHHVFLCRTMWQWDNILQFQIVSHGKEITFASQLVL